MEKVGKMVLKTKPWKNGTNKLSLSRQFRATCKKLERLNLTFLRTRFIFRKGQGIYWKKFFARKGPLPLPNRFLRPTRVHLGVFVAPLNQWLLTSGFRGRGVWSRGTLNALAKRSTLRVLFFARKSCETIWNCKYWKQLHIKLSASLCS